MMSAFIRSIATATPDRCMTQEYAYEFIASHFELRPKEKQLYRRILLDGPIRKRYIGIDYDQQLCATCPEELNERFTKQARAIASKAAKAAIEKVEICSATIFMGKDPGLVISNSIFGDGAAAVVLTDEAGASGDSLRLVDFETVVLPEHREHLRFRNRSGRLVNVLTTSVPAIGAKAIALSVKNLLDRRGLGKADIDFWAVHPGGTRVLQKIQKKFGLGQSDLRCSYDILEEYGNMSSPSVMFVLKEILRRGDVRPGRQGLLLAFGAGFSAFAVLVEA